MTTPENNTESDHALKWSGYLLTVMMVNTHDITIDKCNWEVTKKSDLTPQNYGGKCGGKTQKPQSKIQTP